MKLIKSLIFIFTALIILNSCGSLGDAKKIIKNEKMTNTDEFMVKKKRPLTQPPDFIKIPAPGSVEEKADSEQEGIEKFLKTSRTKPGKNQTKSSSTEESILRQIKK